MNLEFGREFLAAAFAIEAIRAWLRREVVRAVR
jgi:hypothetical protein